MIEIRSPAAIFLALAACSGRSLAPSTSPGSSARAGAIAIRGAEPPRAPFAPEPTLALLGAEDCKIVEHDLGAGVAFGRVTDVTLGFGPEGGLAMWDLPSHGYALRAIDASGAPQGPPSTIDLKVQTHGLHIAPIEAGFVVFAPLGQWGHSHWVAFATDRMGRPLQKPFDLDLDFQDIADAQALGPREVGVLAMRDLVVESWEESRGARWLDLRVGNGGVMSQRSMPLHLELPMLRGDDELVRAHVGSEAGWMIRRGQSRVSEVIHAGQVETLPSVEPREGLRVPEHTYSWNTSLDGNDALFQRTIDGRVHGNASHVPRGAMLQVPVWSGIGWALGMTQPVANGDPGDDKPPMSARVILLDCRQ